MNTKAESLNRREFMVASGVLAAGLGTLNAETGPANSKINLGLIGCGGRGNWIIDLFLKHGGYTLTAAADYFQDKVDATGDRLNIPAQRRFTTLSGYKKLLECKDVDAVVIESPPYFHPQQAQAAVEAGKHVYLAKPIAVDVPGCRTIEASGRTATDKKLCFLVDFQTRTNEHFIEAVRRVHKGAIGDVVFGEAITHTGELGRQAEPGTPEARLRNWVFDICLSGDIITEQQIHTLDVMSWVMDAEPVCATGTGGRKVRTQIGDCWDYFTVLFEYPNKVGIPYSGRQFNAQGTKPEGYWCRIYGTEGVLETAYGGQVLLRSKDFYNGQTPQIYREGAENNIAAFHQQITEKQFENATVAPSVRSNLVTILGRTAAYRNARIGWQELLDENEKFTFNPEGLKL
jgi:predicted dehydrogenase